MSLFELMHDGKSETFFLSHIERARILNIKGQEKRTKK